MRINVGKYKNRKILLPSVVHCKKLGLRPTQSKIRAAVFNVLRAVANFNGVRVLDVYCGSGAFGIEALSVGASHVTFVDISSHNIQHLKSNVNRINIRESVEYLCMDARDLSKVTGQYGLIYVDPPYNSSFAYESVDSIVRNRLLSDDGVLVIEVARRNFIKTPSNITVFDCREYGNTKVVFCGLAN